MWIYLQGSIEVRMGMDRDMDRICWGNQDRVVLDWVMDRDLK